MPWSASNPASSVYGYGVCSVCPCGASGPLYLGCWTAAVGMSLIFRCALLDEDVQPGWGSHGAGMGCECGQSGPLVRCRQLIPA